MPYTEYYDVIVNKISKSIYDEEVAAGRITQEMIDEEVWIFSDDQYVSAENIAKLAGIENNAQVNIIEKVAVNGTDLVADGNKRVNIIVPTKTSDLTNDSGFILNTVDNLVNYYTKNEVNGLINGISTMSMQVVSSLPTSNISTTTIYLVLKAVGGTANVYDEYIYVNNTWEKIGDTQLSLDNYALKSEIPTKLSDLTNDLDLSVYALKSELPTKLSDLTNDLNLSGYENKVESIKVNGVSQPIGNDKSVNITVPTHSNKAILDGTTASFTTELKEKLDGVAASADANVIETVKVNGTALTPDSNKAVNISVPTCKVRNWS